MIELDRIKSNIKDLCAQMETAYRNLCEKGDKREKEDSIINELKAEILLLEQQKVNTRQSLKDEQAASADKRKEYTEKKTEYRKLIEEEEATLSVHKDRVQKEVDNFRIREMSQVKSERDKVIAETVMAKEELAKMRNQYAETKRDLDNLINRIR